jgi:heme/copper-type cytochrome/quinol oxidase subunit 3
MKPGSHVVIRGLPTYAFGMRDPIWWGTILLIAMEGTTLALLLTSYFYASGRVDVWPTTAPGTTPTLLGAGSAGILLASLLPTYRSTRAAYRADRAGMRRWLSILSLASVGAVVLRSFELSRLPFRWDSDVYASMVWGLLVLHTVHLAFGVIENLVFCALLWRGPVEEKHAVDIEANGLYWYFVVAGAGLVSAVVYGEAWLR